MLLHFFICTYVCIQYIIQVHFGLTGQNGNRPGMQSRGDRLRGIVLYTRRFAIACRGAKAIRKHFL